MKNIKDFNLIDLQSEMESIGEKKFRAEQIFKWLFVEKVKSFDEMTNLSLELREKLKQNYDICNFSIVRKLVSKDGTIKYLFGLDDGNAIESVLMEYHFGKSVCVSTQIGCKMGCKFCASTGIKFVRSLSAGEIVEQIIRPTGLLDPTIEVKPTTNQIDDLIDAIQERIDTRKGRHITEYAESL